MLPTLIFTVIGYLSGGLLFAKYFGYLFAKKDIVTQSDDRNPGAYNAFSKGGIACGCATAFCDMAKGFLPVFIYHSFFATNAWGVALVLAAAVVGHCFPIFHKFKGGKGISVSFGSLLGLAPDLVSVTVLGITFIVFSIIIKITPNFLRTLVCFSLAALLMPIFLHDAAIYAGYLFITGTVTAKLLASRERHERIAFCLLPFLHHSNK